MPPEPAPAPAPEPAPAPAPAAAAPAPAGLAAAAVAAAAAPKPGDPPAPAKEGERPDYLPEQFWNKDTQQANIEALAKSYKDTRAAHDALKGAKAPAKAEEYKFEVAKDAPFQVAADDPALGVFRTIAHAQGLSQTQFQSVVEGFLKGIADQMPEGKVSVIDSKEELKKLGTNGQAVVDGVVGWITGLETNGLLSKDEADEMIHMGSTANGIKALTKIMARTGEKPIPLDSQPAGEGLPSKEELYAAVADPKYRTDEGYRNKIDAQFKQVFGTAAAASSEPGRGVTGGRRMVG